MTVFRSYKATWCMRCGSEYRSRTRDLSADSASLIRPKHFEQDMSWLRVGVAIRTAMDINLHRVALVKQAREGLPTWMLRSIIRTWLLGYIIDRTLSAQLGKPGSLSAENATARYQKMLLEGEERPSEDDVWISCLAVSRLLLCTSSIKLKPHRNGHRYLSARSTCFEPKLPIPTWRTAPR